VFISVDRLGHGLKRAVEPVGFNIGYRVWTCCGKQGSICNKHYMQFDSIPVPHAVRIEEEQRLLHS